jgi:hypothetical protein
MSLLAFADESVRRDYLICAAIVPCTDVARVRRMVRELCLPGQRRWHFAKESASRRRKIISDLAGSGLFQVLVCHARGDGPVARAACLAELLPMLADRGVTRLTLECRQGQDSADRRTLHDAMAKLGIDMEYAHRRPHEECCLWCADAIAWAYGAGGDWRRRVLPVVTAVRRVPS